MKQLKKNSVYNLDKRNTKQIISNLKSRIEHMMNQTFKIFYLKHSFDIS
jgi:hypothetical protein